MASQVTAGPAVEDGGAPGISAKYEAVIGLEVHAQLLTESKMFCGCRADYAQMPPNTNVCPVCMGLPGALPVMNRKAVEYTILTALALNCTIPEESKFDRKNYFYPDLPKGYQISQYDMPLSLNGHLSFELEGRRVRAGITRVHLEEDTGTLQHAGSVLHTAASSAIDYNRCGVPLMEIVGEPDLRSAEEAREYLVRLRQILTYLGVNDGNLETGSMRCDANVSLRPPGDSQLGVKVEIKNMNSFRAVHRAIQYEIARQAGLLDMGEKPLQETRGWVETESRTVSQRTKEYAADYRYFPEPDLPPLQISRQLVEEITSQMPELPEQKAARLVTQFGLSSYEAGVLTATRASADTFEAVVAGGLPPQAASRWLLGDVAKLETEHRTRLAESGLGVAGLVRLGNLVEKGSINGTTAKALLEELFLSGGDLDDLVQSRGLSMVSDAAELRRMAEEVIAANPKSVADFQGGKEAALQSLVGGVMKLTRGRADARAVTQLLRELLSAE